MSIEWKIGHRRWNAEKNHLARQTVANHPLQGVQQRVLESTKKSSSKLKISSVQTIVDPLISALDGPDPLSDLLGAPKSASPSSINLSSQGAVRQKKDDESPGDDRVIPWEKQRTSIMAEFTTSTPLTLVSSFLNTPDTGVVKTQTNLTERSKTQGLSGSERVKARLEELDSLDEMSSSSSFTNLRELGGLTQAQFVLRISGLKEELTQAWNSDQRVKSLKICIQCIKLLGMSSPEQFYPSKFMLITDVLDTLATLVYERLTDKSNNSSPSAINKSLYGNEAEETAKNWFYKVSSIRELLPRLYIETALLPCYHVLKNENVEKILSRLTRMIRGIGDPLVATYTRMYVVRVGAKTCPSYLRYITDNVQDFLVSLKWGWSGEGIEKAHTPNITGEHSSETVTARVFTPPLQWMLQCLACNAPPHILTGVLKLCEKSEGVSEVVLVSSVLNTFPCDFLAPQSLPLTQLISTCLLQGSDYYDLMVTLGTVVNKCAPPQPQRRPLLSTAWKMISQTPDTSQYLKSAAVWLQFTATHFTALEVDKLLGDVLKRLGSSLSSDPQTYYPALLSLITTALTHSSNPETLYTMGSFQGLLSSFQRESVGTWCAGVSREVVDALLTHHPEDMSDPSVVQLLLSLCAALHDGLNALTTEDEKRQAAQLITTFIRRVNFHRDFENLLDFYVDARASFSNLESVLVNLVLCVCKLSIATRNIVKGQHTGKTAAFVRACSAYCFITIPSLTSAIIRLRLYLLTAAVSSANHCLGQSDACIKAAIKELAEVMTDETTLGSTETSQTIVANVASLLIAAPDPPDASTPLYLFQGLVNAVLSYKGDDQVLMQLYLAIICALSTTAQDTIPYHMSDVEGNDTLYGGDPAVQEQAERLCTPLLNQIISYIQSATGVKEKRCSNFTLETFWVVTTWGDLKYNHMMSLATLLWTIYKKQSANNHVVKTTLDWIKCRALSLGDDNLMKLFQYCCK